MSRGLIRGLLAALFAASVFAQPRAAPPSTASTSSPILQRFLAAPDPDPTDFRALRRLEARNEHFNSSAWMDVWTEADRAGGFRYRIVAEGGSPYIRSRVFMPTLETECRMWSSAVPERSALTPDNYVIEDRGEERNGLAWLTVRPRRKDVLLIEGSIFVRPEDGDLVRLEGRLAKSPSFWTRRIEIVRSYQRVAGIRMPIALESVATLLIAGRSTFRMSYEYETVNGQRVGNPQPQPAPADVVSK